MHTHDTSLLVLHLKQNHHTQIVCGYVLSTQACCTSHENVTLSCQCCMGRMSSVCICLLFQAALLGEQAQYQYLPLLPQWLSGSLEPVTSQQVV